MQDVMKLKTFVFNVAFKFVDKLTNLQLENMRVLYLCRKFKDENISRSVYYCWRHRRSEPRWSNWIQRKMLSPIIILPMEGFSSVTEPHLVQCRRRLPTFLIYHELKNTQGIVFENCPLQSRRVNNLYLSYK